MAGDTVKGIGVFVSVVAAAGFTFAVVLENTSSEFAQTVSSLGEPIVFGLGFLLVPISLFLLYEKV